MRPSDSVLTRDRTLVVVSFLVLLFTTAPVTRLMAAAWAQRALVYHLTWLLVETAGVGIDAVMVALVCGLVGLLVLFGLDEYKRVQTALLVGVALPVFVLTLVLLDRWTNVGWLSHPVAALVGLGAGLLVGAVGGSAPVFGQGRWEFPTAARALYLVVGGGAALALAETYVPYRTPVRASGLPVGDAGPDAGLAWLVVDVVSVAAFVVVIGFFVSYSDRRDVLVSCPDDRALASLVGGMFEASRDRYNGKTVTGRRTLTTAAAAVTERQLPSVTGRVAFQYHLPGAFRRRTVVTADNARQLTRADANRLERLAADRRRGADRVAGLLRRLGGAAVPRAVREAVATPRGDVTGLHRADVLLLVVPLSEFVADPQEVAASDGRVEDYLGPRPDYVETYERISDAYRGTTPDVFIVAQNATRARALYRLRDDREAAFDDSNFVGFVRNSVVRVDPHCEVVPVARSFGDAGAEDEGFDTLLRVIRG